MAPAQDPLLKAPLTFSAPPRRSERSRSEASRWRSASLSCAALGALLTGCGNSSLDARTVLFISIDTARADTVRFDDPSTMPVLSRVAKRGMIFDEAVTGTSWTLPSHVQMFTGQTPSVHGVNFDDVRIDPRTPTLPQLFDEDGWFTAGFYSGWYLVKDYGFDRGFDVYENGMPGGTGLERELREAAKIDDLAERSIEMDLIWSRADKQSHQAVSSPTVVDKAIGAIDAADEEDLFLFLHFFDPHYDYVPPKDIVERFDPDYTGSIDGRNFYHNKAIYDPKRGGRRISDRDLEHVRALYRGEIYFTDRHIERVLDHLDDVGRMDETFVVVVGDHGEEFFEHGNRGHRATLFDEQLRVPMLMVPPASFAGAARGRTQEAQTSLSDVAPTLLEFANLENDHVTGRSLIDALRGDALESRPELSYLKPFPDIGVEGKGDERGVTGIYHHFLETWRLPDSKFTRHFVYRTAEERLITKEAWFVDLTADPGEQKLIGDPDDPRFRSAWERMEELNAQSRAFTEELETASIAERVSMASDMLGGVLEDLGYADTAAAEPDASLPDASYELPWELGPPPAISIESYLEDLKRRTNGGR